MICSATEVFCDHLSVTYSPSNAVDADAAEFWLSAGAVPALGRGGGKRVFRLGDGYGFCETRSTWVKVEATGQALAHLRAEGLYLEYLSILADAPHSVSRLDAALDLPRDYPEVRADLETKFPGLQARIGRKTVRATELTERRSDGAISGTYYIGQRGKTRSLARIYDKAWEAEKKRGMIMPPTTRVEIEVGRKVGATLRDAGDPAPIFYHFASPELLPRPEGVSTWAPHGLEGWEYERPELTTYETLRRLVERSPDLGAMEMLADNLGPSGRAVLLGLLTKRLGGQGSSSPADSAAS